MKYTLLEMTQSILNSMQGDKVTDIAETEESEAVALIIKENYFWITGRAELPEHKELFSLTETSSATPVLMSKPTDKTSVEWVKYNQILSTETDNNYQFVTYMNFKSFYEMQNAMDSDATNVDQLSYVIDTSTVKLKYRNDKFPEWYTSWDDSSIFFDSYNSTQDSFLRKTKTLSYGFIDPVWSHTNGATPDLDAKQFQLLLNEAKSQAFAELKQAQNMNAERKVRHGWVDLSKNKGSTPDPINAYSKIHGFGRPRK